jgi:hypothetical protein
MLKKLNLNFFGQDGNAFALLGYFRRKAKQAGWTSEEIKKATDEATSGDYEHLITYLMDL